MTIHPRIEALLPELTALRRDLHAHPELLFDVHRTAEIVAQELRRAGCDEVVTGMGRTGVVGVIRGRGTASGKVIGLRADMDALPIEEETNLPHASKAPGKMHACGHDGHTAMLLGAARHLAATRDFDGTTVVIFQPAEEGGGGGREMVADGLMQRFGIQEVFGMHNWPGLPVGTFAIRPGPVMAAADRFDVTVEGLGGHAAKPHETIDPVVATAQIVSALQSIAARNADPLDSVVVSVTSIQAGHAFNIIPQQVRMMGTVRTLSKEMRALAEKRFREIVSGVAAAMGCRAEIDWPQGGYPVTFNHAEQTAFSIRAAAAVVGEANVNTTIPPTMGSEDFSFMLDERPGSYIFLGNGDTAGVHHPAYDFNDKAIPYGVAYWVKVAELAMPAG